MDTSTRRLVPALSLIVALGLSACGSDADTSASSTTGAPAATTPAPTTNAPATTAAPTTTTIGATTTAAPTLDASKLLASLGLVGTDYGDGYTISSPSPATKESEGYAAAIQASPECGGVKSEIPLPFATASSAAKVVFTHPVNGSNSALLVVMPSEAAAVAYLTSLKSESGFAACYTAATGKVLAGNVPAGLTLEMRNPTMRPPIANYGAEQAYPSSDLAFLKDGKELVSVVGGTRYSHIGRVVLGVGGVSPAADKFAVVLYTRVGVKLAQ